MVQMATLGLVLGVGGGGGALLGLQIAPRGAVEPLNVVPPVFQLDVGGEGGGRGLQEAAIVKKVEDSAALLGEGVQDETVL